jgi:hypothetical protein
MTSGGLTPQRVRPVSFDFLRRQGVQTVAAIRGGARRWPCSPARIQGPTLAEVRPFPLGRNGELGNEQLSTDLWAVDLSPGDQARAWRSRDPSARTPD